MTLGCRKRQLYSAYHSFGLALTLLSEDHKKVKKMFKEFEKLKEGGGAVRRYTPRGVLDAMVEVPAAARAGWRSVRLDLVGSLLLGGGVLALHEEDPSLSGDGAMHEGEMSALLGVVIWSERGPGYRPKAAPRSKLAVKPTPA